MPQVVRTLWDEPAVPDPPARVWRDWLLLTVIIGAAVVEVLVRPDVTWRPFAFVVCVGLATTVLWRRTHPLTVVLVVFGAALVLELAARSNGTPPFGLYAMAFVVVLPYALCRWASGRDITIGLAFILVTHVIRELAIARPSDIVAGFAFLLTSAAVGIAVRSMASARRRQLEQYRLLEREHLARDLHDTVAHHMSAIAIQAQAAQAVRSTNPEAVAVALATIESEATRALREMRAMVGTLREASGPELTPLPGIDDISRLAVSSGDAPWIDVHVSGDRTGISPAVDAAVFRIAQESVTNARRHARHSTRIDVRVECDGSRVRLEVRDDGQSGSTSPNAGFGLVGMAERATLLGGTFTAGPEAGGGWVVRADLPKPGGQA